MNEISFKDLKIEHICKVGLKHSYISVKPSRSESFPHAKIILKTPKASQRYIINLLEEKEVWIRKQLSKTTQNRVKRVNLEDEVLLFGEIYSIDVDEAQMLRELLQNTRINTRANILKCYDTFHKEYSKIHILPRVEYFSKLMGLEYQEIKFRKMKSRWGSCSSKRVITFNTALIKVAHEFIDYVVVHELAHIVHMNHSKSFHSLVQNYLPDAKEIRKNFKNINITDD